MGKMMEKEFPGYPEKVGRDGMKVGRTTLDRLGVKSSGKASPLETQDMCEFHNSRTGAYEAIPEYYKSKSKK